MKFITHEDAYEVTTKNHQKQTIPPGTLEFPQVDSVPEFIEFSGGEEKALTLINDLLYSRSKNGALALIRNLAADQKIEDGISKAAKYSKDYNPSTERVSKQAVLDGVDKLREMKDQLTGMSRDDLLALLESTLKI